MSEFGPVITLTLPAEPVTAATRRHLRAQLRAARARQDAAAARLRAAQQQVENTGRLCEMLEAFICAGPGHVFTPAAVGTGWGPVADSRTRHPHCRICDSLAASANGQKPCPGDAHRCPAPIARQEDSPTALQVYQREDWLCGQPGTMGDAFTAWTCQLGHVTGPGHAGTEQEHRQARCLPEFRGCPWPDLITAERP